MHTTKPPLTDHEVEAFTEGDCWALALEIHRREGLPLTMIASQPKPGVAWSELDWCHVAVKVGDLYLDATGLSTEVELLAYWGKVSWLGADAAAVPIPDLEAFHQATEGQEISFPGEDRESAAQRLLAWLATERVAYDLAS